MENLKEYSKIYKDDKKRGVKEKTSLTIAECNLRGLTENALILLKMEHRPLKPFHATGLFQYPLKKTENQIFSDVFRRYRKPSVAGNGLISLRSFQLLW